MWGGCVGQVLSGTTWDGPGPDMTALLHWHVTAPADDVTGTEGRLTVCTASLRPALVRPDARSAMRAWLRAWMLFGDARCGGAGGAARTAFSMAMSCWGVMDSPS